MVSEVREGTPEGSGPVVVDPSGEGASAELGRAAKEVAKVSDKQHRLIESVIAKLSTPEVQSALAGSQIQPVFEECITDGNFAETLAGIDEIVHKYESGKFRVLDIDQDILRLGALLFYLSGRVNAVEMAALESETGMKAVVARAFLQAKDVAVEEKGRLSDEVAKYVALAVTDNIRLDDSRKKVIGHTAKGLYYAGAQLLKMMNDISDRAYRERFNSGAA